MRPGTKVGLIQRRWRQGAFDALANQIEAFCDVDLVKMNPLLRPDDERVSEDVPPPWIIVALCGNWRRVGFSENSEETAMNKLVLTLMLALWTAPPWPRMRASDRRPWATPAWLGTGLEKTRRRHASGMLCRGWCLTA